MMRPAIMFYPGDWQRDAALRSCSVAARGLWIEMICTMHQAEPYGHLVINDKPIQPAVLARMVGATVKEVERWTGELEAAGVFDRENGIIVSRRMVRDERVRRLRAEGGKLGGNPALKDNRKDGVKVGNKVNLPSNLQPTPSVSSSSSSSEPRKASGPVGPQDALWGPGLQGLMAVGIPESQARSFIGGLCAEWEPQVVLSALMASSGKADPRGYARKILASKPKRVKPPNGSDKVLAELRAKYGDEVRLAPDGKEFIAPAQGRAWTLVGEHKVAL